MRKLSFVLVGGALLAACGGSAAPSSAPASKPAVSAQASTAAQASASAPAKPAATASGAGSAAASAKPSAAAAGASASPGGNLQSIKLAYGGAVILQIPLWTAVDAGIFKKYGFDPGTPQLASGRTALEQLIAGQVDLIGAGPYQTAVAVGQGAKIRMMAAFSNKEPFAIFAANNITSPQQLVGQKVATSGPASESATAFILYLKKAGIDPSKVAYITQATSSDQQAALLSGAVVAGAIVPPLLQPELATKIHVLEDLSKSGVVWIPNSFVVPQVTIDQQPDKAARLLQALEEGGSYAMANADFTKGLIKKYMQMDASYLDEAYAYYKTLQAKNLAPTQEALDSVMGQVVENQKELSKDKIEPFYTGKVLDQLKASGFLDKNGATGV